MEMETIRVSGSYLQCEPLFIDSGKTLLAACGSVLQIISTVTGELLKRLTSHSSNISSITLQSETQHVRGLNDLSLTLSLYLLLSFLSLSLSLSVSLSLSLSLTHTLSFSPPLWMEL